MLRFRAEKPAGMNPAGVLWRLTAFPAFNVFASTDFLLMFTVLTIQVFVLKEIIHLLEKAVDKVVFPIK